MVAARSAGDTGVVVGIGGEVISTDSQTKVSERYEQEWVQIYPIGKGIAPQNLVHRQLADDVCVGTVLVKAFDADDEMTDVIILLASGNRRREVAVETREMISLKNQVSSSPPARSWSVAPRPVQSYPFVIESMSNKVSD